MSGQLSGKTREKFIRTFERLVQFDKARINLIFDDVPEKTLTPQQREALLLGQCGDFNYHLWLVQELSRIKGRLEQNGWNGLKEAERTFVRETAELADVHDFRPFAERSLAIAERYFENQRFRHSTRRLEDAAYSKLADLVESLNALDQLNDKFIAEIEEESEEVFEQVWKRLKAAKEFIVMAKLIASNAANAAAKMKK